MDAASCKDCERITSGIETRCGDDLFGPAQSYFGIKARKSRQVPKRVPIFLGHLGNKTSVLSAEHPNYIWMFGFAEGPGLFVGRDPSQRIGVQIMHIPLSRGWQARAMALGSAIVTPNLDPVMFGRLLAKSAHAYAMATKPGQFRPCLIDHIRGIAELQLSHYVGRRVKTLGTSNQLHEIGIHRETMANGRSFFFVRLRLFATIPDTPIHDIVVGEVT